MMFHRFSHNHTMMSMSASASCANANRSCARSASASGGTAFLYGFSAPHTIVKRGGSTYITLSIFDEKENFK